METAQLMTLWSKSLVGCFLVVGMFFVASGIVDRFLGKDALSAKWSAIIVVGLWVATMGFHLLAAAGIFRVWVVVSAVAFLIGIVRLGGYSFTTFMIAIRRDGVVLKNFLLLETNPLQKCLLIILGIGALLVAGRVCILPPLGWDALTYHAVKAGMWVQSGQIRLMEAPGGWSLYRMFPGGGETLQALSMLPFHSDLLVCLVDFVEWLCLIPALFLLGRCVGLDRKSSFIGGLFCLFLPCVLFSVGSCYVDLILALTLMLGVSFAVKYFLSHRKQYLVLGLMSLGLTGGVKYAAYAPICGVLVIVVLHITLCRQLSIQTLSIFGVALMLMLAPMAPWWVNNMPAEGPSLFPISLDVAGIKLSPSNPETDWLLNRPELIPYGLRQELPGFMKLFTWPGQNMYGWKIPNFGILSLLPFCVFPMAVVFIMRRQFYVGLVIIAVIGSTIGFYFLPSFTVVRHLWASSNARFLLGAIFPVIVMSILVFRSVFRERYLDFLLAASVSNFVVGVRIDWQPFEIPYVAFAGAILGLLAWIVFWKGKASLSNSQYTLLVVVILVIILTGLNLVRHHVRSEVTLRSYFFHNFPRYWAPAAAYLDNKSIHRHIAITSGAQQSCDNWFMYMFMGESLQNTVHYATVTENGKIQHFGPCAAGAGRFSYVSWLNRLHRKGISDVMSFLPPSVEISWMLEHPESFEQVTGDNKSGLFRVKREVDTLIPDADSKRNNQ